MCIPEQSNAAQFGEEVYEVAAVDGLQGGRKPVAGLRDPLPRPLHYLQLKNKIR